MRTEQDLVAYALKCGVPDHDIGGLVGYLLDHSPVGGFLTAVLCNDLFGAVGRADEVNRQALPAICMFIHNSFPIGSYGSRELYKEWTDKRLIPTA